MANKRTIRQLIESGELREPFSVLLTDGTTVEGFLVQERVDKTTDTEGYNVYDMRTGYGANGVELPYATIAPNVMVDWADSIATRQTLDFGQAGELEIDNSDLLNDKEYVLNEVLTGIGDYDKDEIMSAVEDETNEACTYVGETKDTYQPGMQMFGVRMVASFLTDSLAVQVYYYRPDYGIDFVEVRTVPPLMRLLARSIGNPFATSRYLMDLLFMPSEVLAERYGRAVSDICDKVRRGDMAEAERMLHDNILFD